MLRRLSSPRAFLSFMSWIGEPSARSPSERALRASSDALLVAVCMPDSGPSVHMRLNPNTLVSDVIDLLLEHGEVDGGVGGDSFRLCAFVRDSRGALLLDKERAIGAYHALRETGAEVRCVLVRQSRIANEWDMRLVMPCIGDASSWFIDTPDVRAFIRAGSILLARKPAHRKSSSDRFNASDRRAVSPASTSSTSSSKAQSKPSSPLARSFGDAQTLLAPSPWPNTTTTTATPTPTIDEHGEALPTNGAVPSHSVAESLVISVDRAHLPDFPLMGARASVCLAVSAHYGHVALSPTLRDAPRQATREIVTNWRCAIDVPLSELPRETRLLLRVCAADGPALTTIAWCVVSVFKANGDLRHGPLRVRLCHGAVDASAPPLACVENADAMRDAPVLSIRFLTATNVEWRRPAKPLPEAPLRSIDIANLSPTVRQSLLAITQRTTQATMSQAERRFVWQWRRALASTAAGLAAVVAAAPIELAPIRMTTLDEVHAIVASAAAALSLGATSEETRPERYIGLLSSTSVDTAVREFAVSQVARLDDEWLFRLLPQLVQAVACELHHESALAQLLLVRASASRVVGQRLYWLWRQELSSVGGGGHVQAASAVAAKAMPVQSAQATPQATPQTQTQQTQQAQQAQQQQQQQQPLVMAQRFAMLLETYLYGNWESRASIERQLLLVSSLTAIVSEVKEAKRGGDRVEVLQRQLRALSQRLFAHGGVDSAIDPRVCWTRLLVERCQVLSAKRAALWLEFETRDEASGQKRVQVVVFKSGEERLRQDMAVLHVLSVLERVWQDAALGVELTTYGCVATGNDSGFVEVVTPAATLTGIVAQGGGVSAAPLVKWLTAAARTGRVAYSDVVAAFASSCAAQCCATYLLGIGTRHGDAVMVRQSGHMFHVDFGSILGHAASSESTAAAGGGGGSSGGSGIGATGGSNVNRLRRDAAPFVLTKEFVQVISGGDDGGEALERFVALGAAAFNAARAVAAFVGDLLCMLVSARLPDVTSVDDVQYVAHAMATDLDANAASELWRRLTQAALAAKRATNRQGGKSGAAAMAAKHRTVRAAQASLAAAAAESSVSLLMTECKEMNALEALLREIATARAAREVVVQTLEVTATRGWTNECSGELRSVLALVEVEHVDLSGTTLRGAQFARAFDGVTARALTSLRVAQCGVVDAQLAALWSVVPRLRLLDLRGNALTDGGRLLLQELLWSAVILEHLDVSGNRFGGEALNEIGAVAMQLGTVETLLTGSTTVDAVAMKRAATQAQNAQRTLASLCAMMRQPSSAMLDVSGARGLQRQLSLTSTATAAATAASTTMAGSSESSSSGGVDWSGLESLVLAHAQLSSLAAMSGAIGTLRHLVSLSLRGNSFSELPRNLVMALAECPLESLDVSFNHLTVLPAALGRLSKLRQFRARGNRLQSVPTLAGGAPLHVIDLAQNEFSVWPAALDGAALAQCRQLHMARNRLRSVPSLLLGSLVNLEYLSLRDNPLEHMPPRLSDVNDAARVAAAMRSLHEGGGPAGRVRVLLMGKEASGKTTVASLLQDSKAKTAARNVSTDGVCVTAMTLKSGGGSARVNLYDFGGQAVFFPTHAFFVSKRSVFLLVVNLADPDLRTVHYWLQQISQVGRPNRVVVVGTHGDLLGSAADGERRLNEIHKQLLHRYAELIDCHCIVSLKDRQSYATVREVVVEEATAMAALSRELPCEAALRARLATLRESEGVRTIDWSRYASVAAELHITHEALLETTRSLHCAGDLMWFETPALRRMVILDPQYVADALCTVVTFRHSFVHDGMVSDADLRAALPPLLVAAEVNDVIKLLECFDVVCQLAGGRWLVPCRLPTAPPQQQGAATAATVATLVAGTARRQWVRVWRFTSAPAPWFVSRVMSRAVHTGDGATVLAMWATGSELEFQCSSSGAAGASDSIVRMSFAYEEAATGERASLTIALRVSRDSSQSSLSASLGTARNRRSQGRSLSTPRVTTAEMLLLRVSHVVEQVIDQSNQARIALHVAREVVCNCAQCALVATQSAASSFLAVECEVAVAEGARMTCKKSGTVLEMSALVPEMALHNVFDELIDASELEKREEIGRGAFGVVYRGIWANRVVAIKTIATSEIDAIGRGGAGGGGGGGAAWREFCNEAHILSTLIHPCVVRLFAVVAQPAKMVVEFCKGGNLQQFVNERQVSAVSDSLRLAIAYDVARALAYLHEQRPPVLHRDLRSPNVLLVASDEQVLNEVMQRGGAVAKLTDFGLAMHMTAVARESLETWAWMAPETRGPLAIYTDRADMFSYAMVVYHMVTHELPFSDVLEVRDAWRVERDVSENDRRPTLDNNSVLTVFSTLIRVCWDADPAKRPSAQMVATMLAPNGTRNDAVRALTERRGGSRRRREQAKQVTASPPSRKAKLHNS
jgi:Ran GTPase-activating protein (RanGAP) involved in mRNA processing and transport/GTPase SAR1 family protein